jgi:hypothetical protein
VPLLVALHGLGETHDQQLGARAWVDRYGLASCYERLVSPPVASEHKKGIYWSEGAVSRPYAAGHYRAEGVAAAV